MRAFSLASLILFLPCTACGTGESKWGTEMSQETPITTATMYYSAAVAPELAEQVFQSMIDGAYNFASNLPEQVDRIQGRLTLRLGNDNKDSIAAMISDPEDGAIRYFHGLAGQVSRAVGGEEVDVILCRESLDDAFLTIAWDADRHL
jgi:hypothetical protein